MKVAVLAALSVLIAIPLAEAGQRHLQNGLAVTSCDNDGHCATLAATRPAASPRKGRPEIKKTIVDCSGSAGRARCQRQYNAVSSYPPRQVHVLALASPMPRRFQAYIDDLENNHGARVVFMGGIRPGHCSPSSEHPCGKALDVCQLRRGVVDLRCNLPGRRVLGEIAASHGLFEGGRWCNSDYGHAQIGVTAAACGDRIRIVRQ